MVRTLHKLMHNFFACLSINLTQLMILLSMCGVHIVSSFSVGTELTCLVAMVALMGDPMVVFERLISGQESASALKKMERGHCHGDEVKATEGVTNLLICFLKVLNSENTVKCISELYVRRKQLNDDETLLCVILDAQGNRVL